MSDMDYYIDEWGEHNFAYKFPEIIARVKGVTKESVIDSAKDVDLNTNDSDSNVYKIIGWITNVLF